MDMAYQINAPSVVSEIIDGEAVIMNLRSGNYYSTGHAGAMIWEWIEQGHQHAELLALVERNFSALPAAYVEAVNFFISELVTHELIRELTINRTTSPLAEAATPCSPRPVFTAPILNVYKDMKDLLLLDPIHDVDETGWPAPKPADKP